MKQKHLILIIVISILNLVIGVALYFYNFQGALSSNSSDWNNFSGYLSLFVNICSLLLIGYVSYLTYDINKIATNTALESQKIQNTPILDVLNEQSIKFPQFNTDSSYLICLSNVGARNIHIRMFIEDGLGEIKTYWVLMNGLIGNSKFEITWLQHYRKFEICYTDAINTRFFLYEYDTIRGRHSEIKSKDFNEMTLNEGFVTTINEVSTQFNHYVTNHWNSINPPLNDFLNFARQIESNEDE